uniref:Uncharacterized protein n=1 Tax=Globodera rostochiensis TaxID=31243 RepID=A0A914GPG9_GLORO
MSVRDAPLFFKNVTFLVRLSPRTECFKPRIGLEESAIVCPSSHPSTCNRFTLNSAKLSRMPRRRRVRRCRVTRRPRLRFIRAQLDEKADVQMNECVEGVFLLANRFLITAQHF